MPNNTAYFAGQAVPQQGQRPLSPIEKMLLAMSQRPAGTRTKDDDTLNMGLGSILPSRATFAPASPNVDRYAYDTGKGVPVAPEQAPGDALYHLSPEWESGQLRAQHPPQPQVGKEGRLPGSTAPASGPLKVNPITGEPMIDREAQPAAPLLETIKPAVRKVQETLDTPMFEFPMIDPNTGMPTYMSDPQPVDPERMRRGPDAFPMPEADPSDPNAPHVNHPPNPKVGTPEEAAKPEEVVVTDPQPKTLEEYEKQVGDLYPEFNSGTSAAADANGADVRADRRTALLAQLAFAGGLAKSGGKAWEGIGEGFTDAAKTYDAGFDRYQKTLDRNADRMIDRQDKERDYKISKTNLALKLRDQDLEQEKLTRAEKAAFITKQWDNELELLKASKTDIDGLDPKKMADYTRRFAKGGSREYIPPVGGVYDIADK